MKRFSLSRLWAMLVKEFIQMRRDRLTFALIFGIPVIQLLMFRYWLMVQISKLLPAFRTTQILLLS